MNKFFKIFFVALLIASLSVIPLSGANGGVQAQVSSLPTQGLLKDSSYGSNLNTSTTVPTPLSPSGTISDTTPAFKWTKITGATQYQFAVYNGSTLAYPVKTVAPSACGTSTCLSTPAIALSYAAHSWRVRAYVSGAWKSYSAYQSFAITNIPTPQVPSGTISDTTPTFKWTRISGATQYGYSLYKGSVLRYSKTVASSACGSSTLTCSNTPTTVLSAGAYTWKVRAYVTGAWKAYSASRSFTLQLPTGFINGGFESGPKVGWTVYSSHNQTLIGTAAFFYSSEITPTVYPRQGSYMARLGGFDYEVSAIGENVRLPNVTPLYMIFYYQIRASSGTDCGDPYYSGLVLVEVNSQKLINGDYLCEYNNTSGWIKQSVNVSAYSGQTVPIVFRVEAPNFVWTYLYLDDISVGQTP